MSSEGYPEKYPPRLEGETLEQWVTRVDGPIPDTEYDQQKDFRCLNLPVRGSREDRESLGDYDYNSKPIRRMNQ
jgi:hypothetical protein